MLTILPAGDSAVSVRFEERIAPEVSDAVTAFARAVENAAIKGVEELIPSYCAVMVMYDPAVHSFGSIKAALEAVRPEKTARETARTVELPVCYGGEYGPDLEFVAENAGVSWQEAVALHCAVPYRAYMLGFTPGFPYLGGMDKRLASPRLESPRTAVPAGSVGIAGEQTGVYPMRSPGGWRIIGRTPLALYDPARTEPFMLRAGDTLRFVPVSADEFMRLSGGVK